MLRADLLCSADLLRPADLLRSADLLPPAELLQFVLPSSSPAQLLAALLPPQQVLRPQVLRSELL